MTGRLLWWGLLAALALITIGAQLDRSARFSPALASLVPSAFAGFAAERDAQRAIIAGQPERALDAARMLVARRPLPAEHLTLLAQARIQAGDQEAAIAALEAATRRGWRDPLAQIAAARAALVDEQAEEAALRLQALFATGALPDQAMAALGVLLQSASGQEAFAARLTSQARWPANLIGPASLALPPEHFAPVLALARAKGAPLNCQRLGTIAARYRDDGFIEEATMVDPGPCS